MVSGSSFRIRSKISASRISRKPTSGRSGSRVRGRPSSTIFETTAGWRGIGVVSSVGTRSLPPYRLSRPTAILHFGAVDYHATVWLNGQEVGEHEGGYLPFELDVSEALRPGDSNELVVRVLDPGNDADLPDFSFAEIPHGKQSWYGPIGGIWQSVYLERRSPTHITRLRMTPDVPGERVRVDVHLSQPTDQPVGLWLNVTDPRGQVRRHRFVLGTGRESAAS